MKTGDKKKIARDYFGLSYEILESWLRSISNVRNRCAHHSRIYNTYFIFNMKKDRIMVSNNVNNKSLFAVLISERIIIGSYQFDCNKLDSIKLLMTEKFNNGIKIILVTKRDKRSIFLDQLHAVGITIIYSDICHKFVSIDNRILWYGGIDPLGYSKENDHIIRVLSDSADEIFGSDG